MKIDEVIEILLRRFTSAASLAWRKRSEPWTSAADLLSVPCCCDFRFFVAADDLVCLLVGECFREALDCLPVDEGAAFCFVTKNKLTVFRRYVRIRCHANRKYMKVELNLRGWKKTWYHEGNPQWQKSHELYGGSTYSKFNRVQMTKKVNK